MAEADPRAESARNPKCRVIDAALFFDARRVLSISNRLEALPVLEANDREVLRAARQTAWDIVAKVAEELIAVLDAAAGDPDIEPNGDEDDGNKTEDDFLYHGGDGPGCPLADPDMAVDDRPCDEPFQDPNLRTAFECTAPLASAGGAIVSRLLVERPDGTALHKLSH